MKMRKLYVMSLVPLIVSLLALVLATPAYASYQAGGGTADSSSQVNNLPPVIDKNSLLVQIVDEGGVAWQWQNGTKSGDRAAPYIFEGEKVNVELDISDANGKTDLDSMNVKVSMGPDVIFRCSCVSTIIDPANMVSKGHYRGTLTIDGNVAQGKYNIAISATDAGGASDAYDPKIYQDTVDILVKPKLTLEMSSSSIAFPSADPGQLNVVASQNPIVLKPQAVIGDEHIPVVFSLLQTSMAMQSVSGDNTIPITKTTWSLSNQPAGATALSGSQQTIASSVKEGDTVQVYYWLNLPFGQAAGQYKGKIDFSIIGD